ncbi:hypothetical protein [Sporolituus thermophilus]|uniref:hypothetical protein n=1 Tax=Sporolituus thermophilus TaxID=608505 RepID=UPI00115FB79E|nr:hypothetical protein [Sporolituus thermophilus]
MADDKTRVYRFWNGKNIDGKSSAGYPDLIGETDRDGQRKAEMKYEVGVDTFAADDLQRGVSYD